MDWIPIIVVLVACTIAAITDFWKFRVYNLLTIPLIVSGIIYCAANGYVNLGWRGAVNGAGFSLMGIAFGFVILVTPYMMGGMGAGDVKLMMGIGAWLGLMQGMYVFIAGALVGGAFSIGLMLVNKSALEVWVRVRIMMTNLKAQENLSEELEKEGRRKKFVPFGGMLFMGMLCVIGWVYVSK